MSFSKVLALISILFLTTNLVVCSDKISATLSTNSLQLIVNDVENVTVTFSQEFTNDTVLNITYQASLTSPILFNDDVQIVNPIAPLEVIAYSSDPIVIEIIAKNAGKVYIGLNSSSPEFYNDVNVYTEVTVLNSKWLDYLQNVIGWIYFAAWSISFYPQVILNFHRKSVDGFSLDFSVLNIIGFLSYSVYNVALYAIKPIQEEFFKQNPRQVIQVKLNDVIFSTHAVVLVLITIIQFIMYNKGKQRISYICMGIASIMIGFIVVCLILTLIGTITWLTYVTNFSYVKLSVTIIKYIPQAVLNFRRKSTVGWSIGNILLDFTGGSLSIIQMIIVAYNSDAWTSLYLDLTKLGLGLFSIMFDVLFIVQHYCLYAGKAPIVLNCNEDDENAALIKENPVA